MQSKKKIFLAAGITLIVLVLALIIFSGGTEAETIQLQQGNLTRTVEDTGYVQPATNYDLHATQVARVRLVHGAAGDIVKQGQPLVTLENLDLALQASELRAQLTQASAAVSAARSALERSELELNDARVNLVRVETLFESGAVTEVEFEKARLQMRPASAV
ncbi:hypothetical protein N752_19185 [Desulforamulus aquiferis]|nr:hypothetical protein [Desulforamulus aquiferis]RYD03533.1 hypothetical protein N752_19185 [Desulforamulus aquiferis]